MRNAPASKSNNALERMSRILDSPPELAGEPLRGETLLTNRWGHGALHGTLKGMASHVIVTYYGRDHDMAWKTNGIRLAARTRSGTITLIPEGHDGRWDIEGPIEVSHVYLPDSRLQDAAEQLAGGKRVELLGRVGFEDSSAARIMELLSREAATNDPASRLFVEQAMDLLCIQLIRGHSSHASLELDTPRGGLADWQIRKVTRYMHEHLDEEIGLEELAALVSLSRFHFCTAFRKATGQTPYNWLVMQRIAEARRLLSIPDLPVTEIALAVGYQTPSAFTAAFRKLVGASPTEYRRLR
jgi:AraC family transcriptional regulator